MKVTLDGGQPGSGSGSATLIEDVHRPLECDDGYESTGPATVTGLSLSHDTDGDGCLDYYELGENGKVGGLLDPFDPDDCNELMDSSGIYRILEVLEEAEGDPGEDPDPGSYHHCIADVHRPDPEAPAVTARVYCYVDTPGVEVNPEAGPESGDGLPGDPPPAPYGDVNDVHTELTGSVDGDTVTLSNCQNHNPTGDPMGYPEETDLHATKVAEVGEKHDSDQDGCPDESELGDNQGSGGLRDPFNHWDYFNPTHDGVNLNDDILLVVAQYGIDKGNPGYTKNTDRSGLDGANEWDFGPPDGVQQTGDILAAVKSYGHDCGTGQLISDDDYMSK